MVKGCLNNWKSSWLLGETIWWGLSCQRFYLSCTKLNCQCEYVVILRGESETEMEPLRVWSSKVAEIRPLIEWHVLLITATANKSARKEIQKKVLAMKLLKTQIERILKYLFINSRVLYHCATFSTFWFIWLKENFVNDIWYSTHQLKQAVKYFLLLGWNLGIL